MTDLSLQDADLKASDLKLLETGILADAEIICRGKTFEVQSSAYLQKRVVSEGLDWKPQRDIHRKSNIPEEEPDAIEIILKYIYGGAAGLDIFKETKDKPVFKSCAELFRAARYLLLNSLQLIIMDRLKNHCDWRLKQLCTRHTGAGNADAKIWAADLANAVRIAYEDDLAPIKMVLWEFFWAGRRQLLGGSACDVSYLVGDSPEFIKDVLHNCATEQWLNDPIWAPRPEPRYRWDRYCYRCLSTIASANTKEAEGQVFDPFTMGEENKVRREWCRSSGMNMIPWRDPSD